MEISNVIVEMQGIQKKFPGVQALSNGMIQLKKGEVHGLVGENGAGKSTLMKILCGIYERDGGTVTIKGQAVAFKTPKDAIENGISMIHQELNLMPHLSVADNIFIGREPRKGFILDEKKKLADTQVLLDSLNLDIEPNTDIRHLTVAKQQMVEIAKALSYHTDVLIMDEPTAALTNTEIEDLFRVIRDLKKKGVGIVYITHRLEELKEITNEITVMRDGAYIDTVKTKDVQMDEIINMMVGRTVYEKPKTKSLVAENAPEILRVEGLNSKDVRNVSFSLKKGEILGFAGLMGAGRTETARLIYGADKKSSGSMYLNGVEVTINSPQEAVEHRIGYLSEDRKRFGLAIGLSVSDNIIMANVDDVISAGIVNTQRIKEVSNKYIESIRIKTPSFRQLVRNLSGGNQQKVVIAKWLFRNCEILIFDEPTRGIDVGAKSEIYKLMNDLAKEGKSIIMISSEMNELLRMSDRIVVMCEGHVTGEVMIEDASQEKIMKLATARCKN